MTSGEQSPTMSSEASPEASALGPFSCLIDGKLHAGASRGLAINPATAQPIADFAVADETLVDIAVAAADRAQRSWACSALRDRRALIRRFAAAIDADAPNLARLLTQEQGKPLAEAEIEVAASAETFRFYADVHADRDESLFEESGPGFIRVYSPLGTVAGIVPWNFPLLIAAMKIAPALLTGNAIIIKPAPTTPLTTMRLAELCAECGPAGLFQLLGDDGTIGPLLTRHPGVRKIAFTGSTSTGRRVMEAAASHLKRITLELGGNDAAIVLGDADVDLTAAALFAAAFTNAGQICGAVKRIYAHRSLIGALADRLSDRVRELVVGNGLDPAVTLGPVQNRTQYERAMRLLADASSVGEIVASAEVPSGPGYFVPPSLIAGLTDAHPLVAEEQFSPLLPILPFDEEDEAITRANASPYGLTASVWSADTGRASRLARRLDVALVGVNKHNESPLELGLSMAKQSGTGWLLGDEGMQEYLQPHLIVT